MKYLLFSLIHAVTFAISAFSYNHINSIREVADYLQKDKKTLLVFDIDNTLLEPTTDLGSDQWFCFHVENGIHRGLTAADAVTAILPLYFHLQAHIQLVPTEPNLSITIKQIETCCAHTICLTSRSFELINITTQALEQNHISFKIPEGTSFALPTKSKSFYHNGVLFCGHNQKGEVMLSFLQQINYQPDLIIFVDDKEKYLLSVEQALQKTNIKFVGLRYTKCDARVAQFDHLETEKELTTFLKKHPLLTRNS